MLNDIHLDPYYRQNIKAKAYCRVINGFSKYYNNPSKPWSD